MQKFCSWLVDIFYYFNTFHFSFVKAFDILAWREPANTLNKSRAKAGHENTKQGTCLTCFKKDSKGIYTTARFNQSSLERHKNTVHKGAQSTLIVRSDDPRAAQAVKLLNSTHLSNKSESRLPSKTGEEENGKQRKKQEFRHNNESTVVSREVSGSKDLLDEIFDVPLSLTFSTSSSDFGPSTSVDESSATQPKTQSALETFFVDAQNSRPSQEPTAKELSDKLDKVLNILSTSASTLEEKGSCKKEVSTEGIPGNSASNITEFLAMNKDIEQIGDLEEKTLRRKIYFMYLNSKSALQRSFRLPSSVCLSSGLLLRHDAYQNCILGYNNLWYRLKKGS